jgi:hypothetical protein
MADEPALGANDYLIHVGDNVTISDESRRKLQEIADELAGDEVRGFAAPKISVTVSNCRIKVSGSIGS